MHFRSHITRLNCAKVARLAWAALVVLGVAGCQSNSERDLMARDRRMQEDQMWAMQDYIQQYQQLVCQFRSENAALRRQLNDDRSGPTVERGPQPEQSIPMSPPAPNGSPQFQNPPAPGTEQKQAPSPNIQTPDVPPLGQRQSIHTRSWYQSLVDSESGRTESDRYAQLASYETPVDKAAAQAADEPPAPNALSNVSTTDSSTLLPAATAHSPDILLTGEVVANDSGGGPRLVIDIESFDQSGHGAKFDGSVSLALLTSEGGVQRRLARWDFGPDDVRAAADASANEPTMRFLVELPTGTNADGATELWAKLAPTSGARLFSHAKLNLAMPGVFSSRSDRVWALEESVVAASYVDTSTAPTETFATINESEWSTAKPGKPAILPAESDEITGGWKSANGPVPAVVESTKPPASIRAERIKPLEPAATKVSPVEVARKPSWTPERPGTQSRTARPGWSATR